MEVKKKNFIINITALVIGVIGAFTMFISETPFLIGLVFGLILYVLFLALAKEKSTPEKSEPRVDPIGLPIHPRRDSNLRTLLKDTNLEFKEFPSRMSYGMIGHLKKDDEIMVIIFPKSFFVHDKDFSINTHNLRLIQTIQDGYEELNRDEKGRIITFEN